MSKEFKKYLESIMCYEKVIELEQENNSKSNEKKEWSDAEAFTCMITYLGECDNYTLVKQPISFEINQKRLFWEEKVRLFLEQNQIIPKFDNETKFLDFCLQNFRNILDKLEPKIVIGFKT